MFKTILSTHTDIMRWTREHGMSMNSPWGVIDVLEIIQPTIGDEPTVLAVHTPSHGGFYLKSELNEKVPLEWREATWNRLGMFGWYEEDCDAAIVPVVFRDLFDDETVATARTAMEAMRNAGFGWPSRVSNPV